MIIVEGAQSVGKTTMIDHLSTFGNTREFKTYKFPYVTYFREFLKKYDGDTGDSSRECHHFTTGYDVTLLSMNKVIPMNNLVVDRGFITNIVFSIVENRSDEDEGFHYIDWLDREGLLKNVSMVYIRRKDENFTPDRNKDEWEFLHKAAKGYTEQDKLYTKFIKYTESKGVTVVTIVNEFNPPSLFRFENAVEDLVDGWKPMSIPAMHPGTLYSVQTVTAHGIATKRADEELDEELGVYHRALFDMHKKCFVVSTRNGLEEIWAANVTRYKLHEI